MTNTGYWGDKRYHSLNFALKQQFGRKVVKLSLDGGFTCPNRDGRVGERGCIFCGDKGGGDFAGDRDVDLRGQLAQQQALLARKWPHAQYIAYFQSFSNTYAPPASLIHRYETVLAQENMVGLAIATRPDCLPPEVLSVLHRFSQQTFLWVELGLQTIHEQTGRFLRRGYQLDCFLAAVAKLQTFGVRVVVHLILGLPGETTADVLATVQLVAKLKIRGVKLHMLHIQRDTDLYQQYLDHPFTLLTQEEYVHLVCDVLGWIPPDVVIHRLTGDGAKDLLVAPKWTLDKLRVLSSIDSELRRRDAYQGMMISPKVPD